MLQHIAKDEAGVSAPEYAILLLLLVTSVVVAVNALGTVTTGVFSNAANGISNASGSSASAAATTTAWSPSPTDAPPPSTKDGPCGSGDTPGHIKISCGSAPSSPGASGYAPGQSK